MQNIILLINNKRNLLVLGVVCASLGYLFSVTLTSIGVILLLICWLLNFKDLNFGVFLKKSALHLLIIFFIFLLIGLAYSEDLQQGQRFLVRHLSFLLLPLVFLTIKPFSLKEHNIIIKVFIYSVLLLFIICFLNAIYRQVIFSNQGGHFNWYFFYRYDFLEVFQQHPTYVSMFTLLSLSYLLDNDRKLFKKNWLRIFILLVQVFSVILYGSRIGYIILFVLLFMFAIKSLKFKEKKEKGKLILTYLMSIVSLIIISWNIPIVKERILFTFGYQQDYKFNNKETIKNSTPEKQGRLLLWEDAFELIKEKSILGYGTGSNDVILKKKYREKGHLLFLNENYNTHNTYLELLLIGGTTLLLIYLIMLGTLFYQGVKSKNFVLISFSLIIVITGLTETLFRIQGIVFFVFFYCFLFLTKDD